MTARLRVKDWDRFQHYKDRSPPWIKLYNDLLENYEFACLPDASKAHLVAIWLLASRTSNSLPADPQWIASKIGATEPVSLDALITAGFLETYGDASEVLACRKHDAIPEGEGEGEGEKRTTSVEKRPATKECSDDFEELWRLHARGPKKKAFGEYRKAVPKRITHPTLVSAVKSYVATFRGDFRGQHLFRWIRDDRWEELADRNGTGARKMPRLPRPGDES